MVSRSASAAAVALALVVHIGSRLIFKWRRGKRYDGLDSIVSYSSRIIAAMRAIEDEEPDKLFDDPLARVLAGDKAMKRVYQLLKEADLEPGTKFEGSPLPQRCRKLTRTVIRTRWFDDALMAALRPSVPPRKAAEPLAPREDAARARLAPDGGQIRQVVLLGAGMDSRAWRLDLPPGVKWFEIDKLDVLNAKRRALEAAGASFKPGQGTAAHPLKAAAWIPLEADLSEANWSALLIAAGFHPELPTVWLAEGLLMYLQPPAVDAMLREMAGISAPGSVLLAMSVTEASLAAAKKSEHSLVRQFVFGCEPDPTPWLAGVGWHTEEVWTRPAMVEAWGIPAPQVSSAITQGLADTRTVFFVAAIAKDRPS